MKVVFDMLPCKRRLFVYGSRLIVAVSVVSVALVFLREDFIAYRDDAKVGYFKLRLLDLQKAKNLAAETRHFPSNYVLTFEDLKASDRTDDFILDYFAIFIADNYGLGTNLAAFPFDHVYFINPLDEPPKLKLLSRFGHYSNGWEISASMASIQETLSDIEYDKGHCPNRVQIYSDRDQFYGGAVEISTNPLGHPATARIIKPWRGLQPGLVLTNEWHSGGFRNLLYRRFIGD